MKKEHFIKFALFGVTFGSMNLPSPRSPRDRKTKSPGSLNSGSSSSFSPIPLVSSSPRGKRAKVIFKADNPEEVVEADDFIKREEILYDTEESPQSVAFPFKGFNPPRSILKRHLKISRKFLNTVHLFRDGSVKDLIKFYSQGTQLSGESLAINRMFKFLLETGQFEKLRLIYEHEKTQLLDFILKGDDLDTGDISQLVVSVMFVGQESEEIVLMIQGESNSFSIKAAAFLHAVNFKTETVYKMFTELIENFDDGNRSRIAREILNLYYETGIGRIPFLIYAAKNDSEETVQNILAFAPEEATRLDSENRSFIYHAACEGNLGILEGLKEFLKGKQLKIPGECPLIGAALNFRDDSLSFFLEDEGSKNHFSFTEKELEYAAFATAVSGSVRCLKVLRNAGVLNIYCYRGNDTLLSIALKNGKPGFATSLIGEFGYDINFVGEDEINPGGHALVFLLDKLTTCEYFLKKGANQNIMVPRPIKDLESGQNEEISFVTLREYLEMCGDAKLVKLFNKYLH